MTASRTQDFSHEGEGIDSGLQYRSSDDAVFATVYLYYPGLPHAGLAAFSTDDFIRTSEPATRILHPIRAVSAGGVDGIAIRVDYANYRGNLASSAVFIKAGRWLVKLRVSGPEARRGEMEDALGVLLRSIEFGAANPPMAPHPLTVSDCPAGAGRTAARLLPDPPGAALAAHGFLATFDGGGNPATAEGGVRRDLPPRIPDQVCLSRVRIGERTYAVLRGEAGAALSVDGRTRLLLPLNDAGVTLEVLHAANLGRYLVLYHEIGMTSLMGGYDAVPSDAQITQILAGGSTEANRIRVPVRFRPNRGPEMMLPPMPNAESRNGTN